MKNPILFLLVILICSCSSESSKSNQGASISLQIIQDTLLVDSGDEVVMAGANLWLSVLSEDQGKLFNYDRKSSNLEVFDLDQLKLVEKVKFDNDGPNAVSAFVMSMKNWKNGNLFLQGFDISGVYDTEGKLIQKYSLHPTDYIDKDSEGDFNFKGEFVFLNDTTVLIGLIRMFENIPHLAKLHLGKKKMDLIDFPYPERLEKYSIVMDGEMKIAYLGSVFMHVIDEKVVFTSNCYNDCMVFDQNNGSFEHIEFQSSLTPNQKEGGQKQKVGSREEFSEQQKIISKQIDFGRWVWDSSNQKFYRLSYFTTSDAEDQEANKTRVFLTVFDKDLKMLAETELDSYKKRPGTYFAKDGSVWIHENVDDDLGFVRLKIAGVG
ncbi:DUF4221 domain-containing protein [Belliella sp. DSM 107340]|uniref:DUF4221 domain-containing protein n=1 Tax=Belliella calami TaxID=2923436 RepID=A0ABS9UPJ3_9BACT|nr:DUF4221 family protein [Belliella calami]MCH7398552.1 DUF4221 domain-containing protein [Belliella calami]